MAANDGVSLMMTPQLQAAIRMLSQNRAELVERTLPELLAQNPALVTHAREPGEFDVEEDLVVVRDFGAWRVAVSAFGLPAFTLFGREHPLSFERVDPDAEPPPDPYEAMELTGEQRAELRGARWALRAIEQRGRAVARVGEALVAHCAEFFDEGPERLVPAPLRAVVDAVAMHESTVQRVLAGKSLRCRHGVFALESFVRNAPGRAKGGG